MEKRNRIKKIMAIIAIFLFIGPLFVVAILNYSNYYTSKHAEAQTAETTSADESADNSADSADNPDTSEE